jgi:hypothetical protein
MLPSLPRVTTASGQSVESVCQLRGVPQNHFGPASVKDERSRYAYVLTCESFRLSKLGTILTPNDCGELLVWIRLPQVQECRLASALRGVMGRRYAAADRGIFTDMALSFTWIKGGRMCRDRYERRHGNADQQAFHGNQPFTRTSAHGGHQDGGWNPCEDADARTASPCRPQTLRPIIPPGYCKTVSDGPQSHTVVWTALSATPPLAEYGCAVCSHRFRPSALSRRMRFDPRYRQST